MKISRIIAVSTLALAASSALLAQRNQSQVEANKKIVHDFYLYAWEPRDLKALEKYMPEGYIENNPMFPGKRDALVAALKTSKMGDWSKPAKAQDKLHDPPELIMAEGDLVTWIFKRTRKDPKDPSKTYEAFQFDTFRIKDGKIVEHWDGATRQ